jgi:hypothetical protein
VTEARSILEIYGAVLDRQKAERLAAPGAPAAQPSSEEPGGEAIVSTETESYLAELEAAEAQAAGLLDGPDGAGLDGRAGAVIRQLRAAAKRHRKEVDRIRDEARTEARQELVRERQTEASYRRLGVPPSGRALFGDLDPTDFEAMQARADELREAGVTWPGQPQPPAPPPPDPNLAAQQAMMAAAAGGGTEGAEGDLAERLRKQAANPAAYSDQERDKTVDDYNRAVQAAGRTGTSGARG